MHNHSTTYRLIAGFTAWILILGTALPSGLHAKGQDRSHCQKPAAATASHHADCNMHAKSNAANNECDWGFACACSLEEAPLKTQADLVNSRPAFSLLPVIIQHFNLQAESIISHGHRFAVTPGSSPPLFLKYGSFLN
ncbi:MAG: hypothetical protein R3211_06700 [Balneolaceae bacterium]|nr:hypothetical protein [Balneolaceae bacterium]